MKIYVTMALLALATAGEPDAKDNDGKDTTKKGMSVENIAIMAVMVILLLAVGGFYLSCWLKKKRNQGQEDQDSDADNEGGYMDKDMEAQLLRENYISEF